MAERGESKIQHNKQMTLAGYHAIVTRFKIAPNSISKLFVVDRRNDFKVKNLLQLAKKK